jgi:hypothetical protein
VCPAETEVPLTGGWFGSVVRVGDTVRRATGPWTPAVHALLRYLEAAGFAYSPRVLGIDSAGREVLSYIEGRAAHTRWPRVLRAGAGLRAYGRVLAEYHAVVSGFMPPADAAWRTGARAPGRGEIILHGDFAPWNTVWRRGGLAGVIDWDFAEPGRPILDVAYAALYGVPLHHQAATNLGRQRPDIRHRLRLFCHAAGGYAPGEVLEAVVEVEADEQNRLEGLGRRGIEPWKTFVEKGELEWLAACQDWLSDNRAALLS